MNVLSPGSVPQVPPQQLLQGAAAHLERVGTVPASSLEDLAIEIPAGVNVVYAIFYELISASASLGPMVGNESGFLIVARDQAGGLAGHASNNNLAHGNPPADVSIVDTGDESIAVRITNNDLANPADYKLILTLSALQVSVNIAVGA